MSPSVAVHTTRYSQYDTITNRVDVGVLRSYSSRQNIRTSNRAAGAAVKHSLLFDGGLRLNSNT